EIGLDEAAFQAAYAATEGAATERHIAQSREWLARVRGSGFPTLALERDGVFALLEPARFLGRPLQWQADLRQRLT
ncbi:DsbA family protein, partial [Achromobacter ruhlandii]|nr:DsbA family protein [Achromobacter ruhlandii]